MRVFKIRNKNTMLFSDGGWLPTFSKRGKTWKKEHYLVRHLKDMAVLQLMNRSWRNTPITLSVYKDCEVVRIEITETEVDAEDLSKQWLHKHGQIA